MKTALPALICATVLAFAPFLRAGEKAEELKIEASGLRLVAPAVSQDEAVRAFNWSLPEWSSGTAVALLLTAPQGGLVRFDDAASALTRFSDDKGTDLLARPAATAAAVPPGAQRGANEFGIVLSPKISQDGRFCAVEVRSPHLPAKGAARLRLEGVFIVLCATEKIEHTQKNVALKIESMIDTPDLELVIKEAGKPEIGGEPFGLTLRASRNPDHVAGIRFYKADGAEIKSRCTGIAKMGAAGALTVDWSYNLAEKVDAATVKVLLWKEVQEKKAPFALDVDVGSF